MIKPYYRILKHDPEGRLVRDSGLMPSHSYVIQFLEAVRGMFRGAQTSATDVDNTSQIIWRGEDISRLLNVDAGISDDTHGIVVGTNAGVTAESNEDYKLDTKILHSGVGAADKLNYQAVTVIAPREVGPNVDYDLSRTFLNESGGTITVKEIGIICKHTLLVKYHLLLRDVVADEDVDDGFTLTVGYTLRTTV